ncbi:MAG: protoheme IX farnesyltransferase [bacterium]|nr:protoheme IX farnesyltransferase [bacterium]
MTSIIRDIADVFKLRIGFGIMLCALAGLAMTPDPQLSGWQVLVLGLAVMASSASAGAFNQYIERDIDAIMERTKSRPFVVGKFKEGWFWPAVILVVLTASVGSAAMLLNGYVALYVFLGAFFYGIVYTIWLKRRSSMNIVVGGLAGSFAVLAGAAATGTGEQIAMAPLILSVVLFLWTPPHFWALATALRDDYAAAKVPMLPLTMGDAFAAKVSLVHTVALVLLSLLPVVYGMGWVYLAGAASGGALFLWRNIQLVRTPDRKTAFKTFHASLIQLGLLLGAAIIDGWMLSA